MLTRFQIIDKLKEKLEQQAYIYALWLEGADANGTADEYSDIDLWVDFEDAFEVEVYKLTEEALSELGDLDYNEKVKQEHPKLRQKVYHIKGSSEYLMIDYNLQLHSRDRSEYSYVKGSKIEAITVIFDKLGIIFFVEDDPRKYTSWNRERYNESLYRFGQHSRVFKYFRRGLYLEAYAYYNRYVFEPLISILRLIYTPANADYYLIHISHHIPEEERLKLEYFARIPTLADIEHKTTEAEIWFSQLSGMVSQEYKST